MSARTPFEPLSRPLSRSANATVAGDSSGENNSSTVPSHPPTPTPGSALGIRNANSTKLNLSGLIGKKASNAGLHTASRDASENAIVNANNINQQTSSDSHSHANKALRSAKFTALIAPKPQRGSLQVPRIDTPLLSSAIITQSAALDNDSSINPGFKVPSLPSYLSQTDSFSQAFESNHALNQSSLDLSSNNAHILTQFDQLSQKRPKAGPPVKYPLLSRRPRSLEAIAETEDEQDNRNQPEGSFDNQQRQFDAQDQADNEDLRHDNRVNGRGFKRKTISRGEIRRSRSNAGVDSDGAQDDGDMEYNVSTKRSRMQIKEYHQGHDVQMAFPPSQAQNYHSRSMPGPEDSPQASFSRSKQHRQDVHGSQEQAVGHPRSRTSPASALSQIFGPQVDIYIAQSSEMYGNEKQRWQECSMEEWVAGASEIAQLFTQALDYTKDHITSKMTQFASLNSSIDTQEKALEDRDQALAKLKDDLVHGGKGVVKFKPKD